MKKNKKLNIYRGYNFLVLPRLFSSLFYLLFIIFFIIFFLIFFSDFFTESHGESIVVQYKDWLDRKTSGLTWEWKYQTKIFNLFSIVDVMLIFLYIEIVL